jgi:hypothetical protein
MTPQVYLAFPYSHTDPEIVAARCVQANRLAEMLASDGASVFSPISHAPSIVRRLADDSNWDFLRRQGMPFLRQSAAVVVAMSPGWGESNGIVEEIVIASDLGLPIWFVDPGNVEQVKLVGAMLAAWLKTKDE